MLTRLVRWLLPSHFLFWVCALQVQASKYSHRDRQQRDREATLLSKSLSFVLSPLTEGFEARARWWEGVVFVRRLALAVIVAFVVSKPCPLRASVPLA